MLDPFGPQSAACVSVPSAELQLKLADTKSRLAAAGMGMESGTGHKLMGMTGPAVSKRKLLVGLDVLCLFLGKNLQLCVYLFIFFLKAHWFLFHLLNSRGHI